MSNSILGVGDGFICLFDIVQSPLKGNAQVDSFVPARDGSQIEHDIV